MSSVDDMISNAVSTASYWGWFADGQAFSATDGLTTQKITFNPAQKPNQIAQLGSSSSGSSSGVQNTNGSLNDHLDQQLTQFFNDLFPVEDAYNAARAWVIDALKTGVPKLPGNGISIIWGRAQDYTQALGNTLDGLDLPAEALTAHTNTAFDAFAAGKTYALSEANVDLFRHAVNSSLRDIRAEAISAVGAYISARASSSNAVGQGAVAITRAKTRMASADASWYAARVTGQAFMAEVNATEAISKFETEAFIEEQSQDTVGQRVKVLINAAEAMAIIAQAAASAANSVVSESVTGFS